MVVITYSVSGFFSDMSYTAELPGFFKEFENQFIMANKVTVTFKEEIVINLNRTPVDPISCSEDGTEINIVFTGPLYLAKNGKLTDPLTPSDMYSQLRRIMNRAVTEDNKRFNKEK